MLFVTSVLQVIFFQEALHTNQIKTFLLYGQWHSKNSDLLSGVSNEFVVALRQMLWVPQSLKFYMSYILTLLD